MLSIALAWPPAEATFHALGHQCGLPKIHSAFGLLHTCMLHKHEITHSARLAGKLAPEAAASVSKCFFDPHTHLCHTKVCKESLKSSIVLYTCFTAHLFIPVLASIPYSTTWGAPLMESKWYSHHGKRRGGTTTHLFPLSHQPWILHPRPFRLQPTSEGALHVLWMRWGAWEDERGGDDGYGVIARRWKRRREELSCGSVSIVKRRTRQLGMGWWFMCA